MKNYKQIIMKKAQQQNEQPKKIIEANPYNSFLLLDLAIDSD